MEDTTAREITAAEAEQAAVLAALTGKTSAEIIAFMARRCADLPDMSPGVVWWSINQGIQTAIKCGLPIDWSA